MPNVESRPYQWEQYLFRELGDQNIEFAAMTLMSVGPIGEYPLMNKGLFAVAARYAVKKRHKYSGTTVAQTSGGGRITT